MKPNLLRSLVLIACLGSWLAGKPATAAEPALPPGEADAKKRIESSPRHGEWVDIEVPGSKTPLRSYVVYPERKDKAGVVIVIQEIFGLTDWIRSVADQLAADGFIAIAPDMLSGKGPNGGGTESFGGRDAVVGAVRGLDVQEVTAKLNAAKAYAQKIPAANGKVGTVGFCWGGSQSFSYATNQPELSAAVVYYGSNPSDPAAIGKVKAPVLGLYGADDARVNSTIKPADDEMKKQKKSYTYHIYEGAGHGFLRQQDGRDGANAKAAQQAWPATIEFFRTHLK
jgi:carboxymethylenebutenolidase